MKAFALGIVAATLTAAVISVAQPVSAPADAPAPSAPAASNTPVPTAEPAAPPSTPPPPAPSVSTSAASAIAPQPPAEAPPEPAGSTPAPEANAPVPTADSAVAAAPAAAPAPAALPAPALAGALAPPPVARSSWSWAHPAAPTAGTTNPGSVAADTGKTPSSKESRLPWRGTAFIWSHSVTTSAVGVGADYLSQAHQVYVQNYSLLLNYYLFKDELWSVRTSIAPALEVEFTDSSSTTTRREPVLEDTPANLVVGRTLDKNEKSGRRTVASGNLTLLLPTSEASRDSGVYFTLSPRVGVTQSVPLFGPSAPVLKTVTFVGGFRWDHLFSAANTPVSGDLSVPAQDLSGNALQSDLLSGDRFAPNTYRLLGAVAFSEELFAKPFELQFTGYYQSARLYGVGTSTLELGTGSYQVEPAAGARNAQPSVGVAGSMTYVPVPELAVTLGYANRADLGSDEPDPLYTPRALFVGSLALSLDALYLRLKGEPASEPTFLAKDKRQRGTF